MEHDEEHHEMHKELERIFETYVKAAVKDAMKSEQCPRCFYMMMMALAVNGLMIVARGDDIKLAAMLQQAIDIGTDTDGLVNPAKMH